jgi:hypothetical protein
MFGSPDCLRRVFPAAEIRGLRGQASKKYHHVVQITQSQSSGTGDNL